MAQSTPEAALAAATQRLAARGVTEGVRMTTTGKVLPGAAVRASAASGAVSNGMAPFPATTPGSQPSFTQTPKFASGGTPLPLPAGKEDPAARLAQLMAQKALARNRAA